MRCCWRCEPPLWVVAFNYRRHLPSQLEHDLFRTATLIPQRLPRLEHDLTYPFLFFRIRVRAHNEVAQFRASEGLESVLVRLDITTFPNRDGLMAPDSIFLRHCPSCFVRIRGYSCFLFIEL